MIMQVLEEGMYVLSEGGFFFCRAFSRFNMKDCEVLAVAFLSGNLQTRMSARLIHIRMCPIFFAKNLLLTFSLEVMEYISNKKSNSATMLVEFNFLLELYEAISPSRQLIRCALLLISRLHFLVCKGTTLAGRLSLKT